MNHHRLNDHHQFDVADRGPSTIDHVLLSLGQWPEHKSAGVARTDAAATRFRFPDERLPRCWLVHGFNVRDLGAETIDQAASEFERRGYVIAQFDYGWTDLLQVRFGNSRRAKRLADQIRPGDIAVGHSNGCTVIQLATAEHGAPLRWAVYINPALDCDTEPAPQIEGVDVWHNASDETVKASRLLWFHSWGAMGAYGYSGNSPKVINYNKGAGPFACQGHSDVFQGRLRDHWMPQIADAVPDPGIPA